MFRFPVIKKQMLVAVFLLAGLMSTTPLYAEMSEAVFRNASSHYKEMILKKQSSADTFISTALRMNAASENPVVSEHIKKAQAEKTRAEELLKAGKHMEGMMGLDTSINEALQAVAVLMKKEHIRDLAIEERNRSKSESTKQKLRAMTERKVLEAETLINTAKRLSGGNSENRKALEFLNASLKKKETAMMLVGREEYERAMELLTESYTLAVQSIREMREDQVSVHKPLTFATEKEEYQFEMENNDTYLQMAQPLKKKAAAEVVKMISEGEGLKRSSEEEAGASRYKKAIDMLKKSTGLFIRAIEQSGTLKP